MTTLTTKNKNNGLDKFFEPFGLNKWFFDDFRKFPFSSFEFIDRSEDKYPTSINTKDGTTEITVIAPGLSKEQFNISFDENILTISFENNQKELTSSSTFAFGEKFTKSWTVAKGVTPKDIGATYDAGILKVTIKTPKKAKKIVDKIKVL